MQPLTEKMAYNKPIISQEEFTQLFPVAIETLLSLSQAMLVLFTKVQDGGDIEALGPVFSKQVLLHLHFLLFS